MGYKFFVNSKYTIIYQGGISLGGTKKPPAKPAIALSTGEIL